MPSISSCIPARTEIKLILYVLLIFLQADLLFKKEEKEKSEATAKTLELGVYVLSVHFPVIKYGRSCGTLL